MENKVKDLRQQLLNFEFSKSLSKNDFFVSESNFYAYSLLLSWPKWEKKIINIHGERYSGKTHLIEIFLKKNKGLIIDIKKFENYDLDELRFNEILAIGPSISVLMEGYQGANITSLRGTLVPAKTLNTLISKIPVIGNIIIPKEVGEGLFGISFKMKGPPGNIKTTINPIRTITPRFIQKIIDKKKKVK